MEPAWKGYFHDGRTAERHAVTVSFGTSALEIADAEGRSLASWPYAELRTTERIRPGRGPGRELRLARGEVGEARLLLGEDALAEAVLADEAPLTGLLARAPQLGRRSRLSARACRRLALAAAGIVAVAGVLWFLWPPVADLAAGLVPRAWEERLGQRLVEDLTATDRICDQPAGKAALDRLTARLTGHLAASYPVTVPVKVTVVDRAEVNAFAAPGGHILILRGLIDSAASADEVAGVLAHEIGHAVERHGMRSIVRNLGIGLVFEVMAGGSSLGGVAPVLAMLAYSRDFEREADARAVELLIAADIGTGGLAGFFDRLAREEGKLSRAFAYFSTHPAAAQRRLATTREPYAGGPAMSSADWAALRGICGGSD